MITKTDLRKTARKIRNSLDMKKISEKIVENIFEFEAYQKATHIMFFYPLENEVNLLKLLEDKTKSFYLPKVDGDNLLVCPYKIGDELAVSKFKTREPVSKLIANLDILDIIFVPALMADKTKNRLGYGGGFYDRFLSKQNTKVAKIVAIPSALIIDELPLDYFDEIVDVIISENAI